MKKIANAKLVMIDRILEGYELAFEGGRITEIAESISGADEVIDAQGSYLAPGFVDRHIHGGWGFDFEQATSAREIVAGANEMAQFGCTALVPTTNTTFRPTEQQLAILDYIDEAVELSSSEACVEVLGTHIEGAFMMTMAEDENFCLTSDHYEPLLNRMKHGLIWTVDPECKGAPAFVAELTHRGIIASIGHTDACSNERFKLCLEAGATSATHIYTSMSGVTRVEGIRYPGAIENSLSSSGLVVEILSDEAHLGADLVKYIYRQKGAAEIIIATDCHGRPEKWTLGTPKMELAYFENVDKYAWSGSPGMSDCVLGAYKGTDIPLHEVIRMATINPARQLGVGNRKGLLCIGFDADLVLFDEDINVKLTIARGKTVHEAH